VIKTDPERPSKWDVEATVITNDPFRPGESQSSSAPAPSGSISSTLRPVSAESCSTIVR
jgi:hypothetical protein